MTTFRKIRGLLILLLGFMAMFGCRKVTSPVATNEKPRVTVESNLTPQSSLSPTPALVQNSPIRKFAFTNFSYPDADYGYSVLTQKVGSMGRSRHFYKLEDGGEPEIRDKAGMLKNSPASLSSVEFEELTGDSEPEALIRLSILTGGSAMANALYVYTWDKKRPKKIFSFSPGDRADGGFRTMYADSGDLLIELNAGDEKAPDCDGCQSTRFMRIRYQWNGRKFEKVKQEVLPIK